MRVIFRSIFYIFFLEVSVQGLCPEPFESVQNKCYYFELEVSRTWDNCRARCQSLGGDLAILNTCEEFSLLVKHIHISQLEIPDAFSFFVGGTDRGDEGVWYWVDGSPVKMGIPLWGQTDNVAEPSGGTEQNCATLNKANRYYLHDGECDKNGYAICQIDPLPDL
ncbi:C-type lectin domain family 4 member E-like [Penaeus monodon]|uniref:C-type lectin n=1 Tax=Penaeus monodon TaxID=6687 RepID=A0A4D6WPB2_PENMO|nr:C-type lectin domain family 4 member E-like [Penaeus monodon]QCI03100.1 C-type lectin [Penaeus monodon]